jgi:hypothetical protein
MPEVKIHIPDSHRPYGTVIKGEKCGPRVPLRSTLGYFRILPNGRMDRLESISGRLAAKIR